jgi:transcriptional regulator with XRE-family HTH domain
MRGAVDMRKRRLTPFGELVNKRLIELNMTQKRLAEKVGTSEVYLSMILRGERSGEKYMDNIIKVLNIEQEKMKNQRNFQYLKSEIKRLALTIEKNKTSVNREEILKSSKKLDQILNAYIKTLVRE